MAHPNRDPVEDSRILKDEATQVGEDLLHTGVISFASRFDLHSSSLGCDNYDNDAESPIAPPILQDRPWQTNLLHMAAKSISRRLLSWRERTLDSLFPSSFEYTPIEMDDRSLGPAEYHSNKLQVDKGSTHDMAGDCRVVGAESKSTNAKSTAIMREDEPVQSSASGIEPFEGDEPTEEELATLRKVADHLPWSAFIVALVELCERFTYWGLSGPFQNYIQYHPHDTPVRGGIGMAL